ncbi:hypothetical protein V9T40_010048 [Parthenolecanium corni]|uniref:GP-PDE domain-containing protein n=1 Tax=Parthenolecanium corni TaxID=536013 RepID=A0AAN9TM28_9HEMI
MFYTSVKWDLSSTLIGIFGAYTLTSFVLFKYPTLLHKKKHVAFLARHISHRGGGAVNEAGTNMLELDCHITKDGKVVVVHDSNLLRLTGFDRDVISLNYDELPFLKNRLPIEFQPGEYFSDENVPSDQRKIPLLEEVFKNFSHLPVNIDIKQKNIDLIEQVSYLISKYKMEEHCVWGNKSADITEECYKQNPNIHLLFSTRKVIIVLLYFYTGLLPFVPLKETHLEIFVPTIYHEWAYWQKHKLLAKLLLRPLNKVMIRKSLFTHLQRRGIQVYLWVLNEETEFEEAFKVGATGVMTDYPTKLTRFLQNNERCLLDEFSPISK